MKNTLLLALCATLAAPDIVLAAPIAKHANATARSVDIRDTKAVRRMIAKRFVKKKPWQPPRVTIPTPLPTSLPITVPTVVPTPVPTALPTVIPTMVPTAIPTPVPTVNPTVTPTPLPTAVPTSIPVPPPMADALPGLTPVDDQSWDDTAVRKVLQTFAYGGQATDEQIKTWADMPARSAIVEMLRWDEHNLKLSPPAPADRDNLTGVQHTLANLINMWAAEADWNRMPPERRQNFAVSSWHRGAEAWMQSVLVRGLNPFRGRIGFWETNYHMAVSTRGRVNPAQQIDYYDTVMEALSRRLSYEDVLARAALSPAITRQYDHWHNRWYASENSCSCNEDFGREFHQLFFGVWGIDNPAYHESVSIKNTALMLTDIDLVNRVTPSEPWDGAEVVIGTQYHYTAPLAIAHHSYASTTARDGIEALARDEINHPESLANLPVMIVQGLADDHLSAEAKDNLRTAWRAMSHKDLLTFLHAYATSTLFHSPTRLKYKTSFDRHLNMNNQLAQSNEDIYLDLMDLWRLPWEEQELAFAPDHVVFGAQTGTDAINNASLFRLHYNAMSFGWHVVSSEGTKFNRAFRRDWGRLVPRSGNTFKVGDTAAWLWQRMIADGLKNFGPLEKAYLYALLATGQDFAALIHPNAPDTPPTLTELQSPEGQDLLAGLAGQTVSLDSTDPEQHSTANQRVGQAAGFIAASPYYFAQEGR